MAEAWSIAASNLCDLASSITGLPCHFIYNTESKPFSGGEYTVYVLENTSKTQLAIRIPNNRSPHTPLLLKREADFRQRIDSVRLPLFPPLFSFSETTENSLGAPYLALGWVDGSPLIWSDTHPPVGEERNGVLRMIANASLDLLQINETGASALDWIESKIRRKISRAQTGSLPGGTVAQCERQMELTRRYWMPDLDAAPHVLIHGDLSGNNIIVDRDNTVKGIIDLGWAELVPLQFAAAYPRFLTFEPFKDGEYDWTARRTSQTEQDRAFYLQCIMERATKEGENSLIMDYYHALARDDEVARYWWIIAASRIDIHHAMVQCDWNPPVIQASSQTK